MTHLGAETADIFCSLSCLPDLSANGTSCFIERRMQLRANAIIEVTFDSVLLMDPHHGTIHWILEPPSDMTLAPGIAEP